jgi:MFS family permease
MPPSRGFASYFGGVSTALAIRDYRIYWLGQAISVQGVWIWRISSGVLIFQLTHSPAWLGFISVIYFVPLIFVGPLAGAIADRLGHRRTAIASLWVAISISFTMAVLSFLGLMNPYILAALVAVLGVGHAFDFPARQVLIQILVGSEQMSAAIALNSTTFNTAAFTGPAIGAALLAWGKFQFGEFGGPGVGFLTYTAGSLWFMISLVRIRARDKPSTGVSIGHLYDDVLEGFRYIGRHQTIRTMMVSWIVISFLTRAYTDLLPGFAEDVFHRGSEGLGILLSASGGGALILSIVMAVRGRIDGMARLFVVAAAVAAVSVLVFVWADNFWIATAAMAFAGAAIVVGAITAQTLVQSTVEPEFRGRVIAVYLSLAPSAQAVGSFVVGWLAEITSLPSAVAAGALAAMVVIAVVGPKIWRRGPAMEAEAQHHVPAPAPAPKAVE